MWDIIIVLIFINPLKTIIFNWNYVMYCVYNYRSDLFKSFKKTIILDWNWRCISNTYHFVGLKYHWSIYLNFGKNNCVNTCLLFCAFYHDHLYQYWNINIVFLDAGLIIKQKKPANQDGFAFGSAKIYGFKQYGLYPVGRVQLYRI